MILEKGLPLANGANIPKLGLRNRPVDGGAGRARRLDRRRHPKGDRP